MASKKKSTAATSDTSGMSLADFKSKYKPAAVSSATIGVPGKTYVAKGSGPSYVGPTPKGADKGMFAGSSTPLGTSLAGSNLSKGNVINAALIGISLPAKAGSIPVIATGKVTSKLLGRYVAPAVEGAGNAAWTSATKGLGSIREGGRTYISNTVFGKTLASTQLASAAQTAARLTGLEANAARISTAAARGATAGGMNMLKDIKTGKRVLKGAALLGGGIYSLKNK